MHTYDCSCCKRKYNKSLPPMSPATIPLKEGEINKDDPMSPSASSFNEPPICQLSSSNLY